MQLSEGQIVISKAGRDVKHVYMISEIKGEKVLLVDGRKRTFALPKVKNIRHISPSLSFVPKVKRENDLTLKAALKAFCKSEEPKQGG